MVIEVKKISRSFKSIKKKEGLKGALELLLRPEVSIHEALTNVSFSLEAGSFTGLIGANGAGKTTLLKILSGLIAPSQGEALVLGYHPFDRHLEFRRQIALVMGQKAQLWWDLPARDAFDLIQAIYEIPKKIYLERLGFLSELLQVKSLLQTQIRRLSLGERMKMELIGALLHWPKVIFLDEPTIGLDGLAAHKLREFLKEFNKTNKSTIILTSHNMDDIEKLCSRVLILKTGSLIYDGAPEGLTQTGKTRLRVRFSQPPTIEELAQKIGLDPSSIHQKRAENSDTSLAAGPDIERMTYFHSSRAEVVPLLQKILANYSIKDMSLEEEDLETVIQRIYQGEPA